MELTTKKIVCDLLVGFMCMLGLFMDKTEEQENLLIELDEEYAKGFCGIMGMHPIVIKFFDNQIRSRSR